MYNESTARLIATHHPQAHIQDNPDPHTIVFGNGSSATTSMSINVTNTYCPVVFPNDYCPNNLLPEKSLSDLNCVTTFQRDICTIAPPPWSNLKAIITRRDPDTRMFHVNLQDVHSLIRNLQDQELDNSVSPDPSTAFSAVLAHQSHHTIEYKVVNLHETMGHASCEAMCAAVSGPNPAWTHTGLTEQQIRKVFSKYTCLPCAAAKRNLKSPARRDPEDRKKWKPGECFSCDPAVKINPKGYDGSDCFFLFKDLATGFLIAVITDSKKATAFTDAFQLVLDFFDRQDHDPTKILRTDSEVLFLSAEVKEFLRTNRIESQTSAPDCHYQVSVERDMQTLFKGLSTMLNSHPFLRYDLWPLALVDYLDRKNRTPNKRCYPKSPYQVVTNSSTDLSAQLTYKFGDVVLAGSSDRLRDTKFDPKNEVGLYIGQEPGTTHTHRIFMPHNSKIKLNGSVSKIDVDDEQLKKWIASRVSSTVPVYRQIEDAYHDLLAAPVAPVPAAAAAQEIVPPAVPTISADPPNNPASQTSDNAFVRDFFGKDIFDQFTTEEQQAMLDTKFVTLLEKYANLIIQQQRKPRKSRFSAPTNDDRRSGPTTRSQRPAPTAANVSLSLLDSHLFLPSSAEYRHYAAMSAIYCNAAKTVKKATKDIDANDTPTVAK
jgi:hypothetical protein